jgi:proteic killer suppression protein
VKIRNFVHKGLKGLYLDDSPKGLPSDAVDKTPEDVEFLQDVEDEEEFQAVPVWKAHVLKGARKGVWSLHVTRNWRLTFRIDPKESEVFDLNFEDYH